MSEMVERVARALADCAMEPFDELSRSKYMGDARAAIEAMREPTQKMINILSKTYSEIESVELDDKASETQNAMKLVTHIAGGWHDMIDEALK